VIILKGKRQPLDILCLVAGVLLVFHPFSWPVIVGVFLIFFAIM